MGTISTSPVITPLSLLTEPSGPFSAASLAPQSVLKSASPTDLASLSKAAASLSEANFLFGGTTPDLFPSNNLVQPLDPALSLLDAAFGLTPTTNNPTTDLLQEGLANQNGTPIVQTPSAVNTPSVDQSLLSLFGNGASNTGNLVDTTG